MTPHQRILIHEGYHPQLILHSGDLAGRRWTISRKNYATFCRAEGKKGFIEETEKSPGSPCYLDAILLGDSWVDSFWGDSVETWPVQLCKRKRWNFLNVAQAGTGTVAMGTDQLEVLKQQLADLNLRTDDSTLWIIHSGGNDMLYSLAPNWLRLELDVMRMHIARCTAIGGWFFRKWMHSGEVSQWSCLRATTMLGACASDIADNTRKAMLLCKNRFGARRFLVASNTISSAMPLCRLLSFMVTPYRGRAVLDNIALICASRLTRKLAEDALLDSVDIKFFDEQATCVEKQNILKWQHDGFHPLVHGHALLADGAERVLDDDSGEASINAAAVSKTATINALCSEPGECNGLGGCLETIVTLAQVLFIGVPLTLVISLLNILSLIVFICAKTSKKAGALWVIEVPGDSDARATGKRYHTMNNNGTEGDSQVDKSSQTRI